MLKNARIIPVLVIGNTSVNKSIALRYEELSENEIYA